MNSDEEIPNRVELFWCRIQQEIGEVAPYIKNIINFQQLAATKALGNITIEDILLIEDQMRNAVPRVRKLAVQQGKSMQDYYGSFSDEPTEFRFTVGDVKVLQTVVETVTLCGIHKLLSLGSVSGQQVAPIASQFLVEHQETQEWNALKLRIKFQLSKANDAAESAEMRYKIIESLDKDKPQFATGSGGKIVVNIACPICAKSTKLVREPPRSWPIFNLLRHLNRHLPDNGNKEHQKLRKTVKAVTHSVEPGPSKIRQVEPSTLMVDIPSETNIGINREISLPSQSKQTEYDEIQSEPPYQQVEYLSMHDPLEQTHLEAIPSSPTMESFTEDSYLNHRSEEDAKAADVMLHLSIEPADVNGLNWLCNDNVEANELYEDPCEDRSAFELFLQDNHAGIDDEKTQSSNSVDANDNFLHNNSNYLEIMNNLHRKTETTGIQARRYNAVEKDMCAFEYLTTGNAHYEYLRANMATMSKKTIQRHINQNTIHIKEGIIDAEGLKTYLVKYGFPLTVVLCEDGTKITSSTDYEYNTDSITGLVSPLDENGLPVKNLFQANSPYKMVSDLKSYPVGSYAYVQMAIPLSKEAAPYVIYHACSNNRFSYKDVLNRWEYTEALLKSHGISVLAHASDGDTRLMKAMRHRAGFDKPCTSSPWGPWFRVDCFNKTPINVQDMTHTVNKLRNRLLNGDMTIGKYEIKKDHLKQLIENHSKDKHGLCMSDINLKDKMKFDSTEKLMKLDLVYFMKNVPDSKGTALFIDLMRRMYRSFERADYPVLERIEDIWTSLFIVRGWRNFCKRKYNNLAECITPNAYHCLELDAHALILFICICRDNQVPEQCIIEYLSSQPCEKLFRELRSLSSTRQTVVNFSIKELTEKLKRIHMTRCIMYKNRDRINYPYIDAKQQNQSCPDLPTNDDIIRRIENCKINAEIKLLEVGIEEEMIDLSDSVCNHAPVQQTEFVEIEDQFEDSFEEEGLTEARKTEFVAIESCFEGETDDHEKVDQNRVFGDDNQNDKFDNSTNTSNDDFRPVYEASKVFTNCDVLNLKNSVSGHKHTFRISDSNGQIKNVKKSTLLWMLTDGRNRLSSDRMRRFQQKTI